MAVIERYQKVASWQGLIYGGSLWLGSDHLLSVRSLRFSEEYKRFYYRDIQALLSKPNRRPWFPSFFWLLLPALALAAFIVSAMRHPSVAGLLGTSVLALGGFAVYQTLAAGASCFVLTAVGTEELVGVRTRRVAARAAQAIRQRVLLQQGELPSDWRQSVLQAAENPAEARDSFFSVPKQDEASAFALPSLAYWSTLVAVGATFIDGVFSLGQIWHWGLQSSIGLGNVLLGMAAAITTAVLLRSNPSGRSLRLVAFGCAFIMALLTYLSYMLGVLKGALPLEWRAGFVHAEQIVQFVNVFADFLAVLWGLLVITRRSRVSGSASAIQPILSAGDLKSFP